MPKTTLGSPSWGSLMKAEEVATAPQAAYYLQLTANDILMQLDANPEELEKVNNSTAVHLDKVEGRQVDSSIAWSAQVDHAAAVRGMGAAAANAHQKLVAEKRAVTMEYLILPEHDEFRRLFLREGDQTELAPSEETPYSALLEAWFNREKLAVDTLGSITEADRDDKGVVVKQGRTLTAEELTGRLENPETGVAAFAKEAGLTIKLEKFEAPAATKTEGAEEGVGMSTRGGS